MMSVMPRLITTITRATVWEDASLPIPQGAHVRVSNLPDEYPTTGTVANVYFDDARQAYLAVVALDQPLTAEFPRLDVIAPFGTLVSRMVVHPEALQVSRETNIVTESPVPPCSDCGGESRGFTPESMGHPETPANALCDECALDLDREIVPHTFVIAAQLEAEDRAGESSPRRARQSARRRREITDLERVLSREPPLLVAEMRGALNELVNDSAARYEGTRLGEQEVQANWTEGDWTEAVPTETIAVGGVDGMTVYVHSRPEEE